MYQGSTRHWRDTYLLDSKTQWFLMHHNLFNDCFLEEKPQTFVLRYTLLIWDVTYVNVRLKYSETLFSLFSWNLKGMVIKESETWTQYPALPYKSKSQNKLPHASLSWSIKWKLHYLLGRKAQWQLSWQLQQWPVPYHKACRVLRRHIPGTELREGQHPRGGQAQAQPAKWWRCP